MQLNRYQIVSNWRVLGEVDEVYGVISDAKGLARWWPAGYRATLEIQPGDERGIDKVVRCDTKGLLPFNLRWHANTVEAEPPRRFKLEIWGDIAGTSEWRFEQDGAWVLVTNEWDVQPRKAIAKYPAALIHPGFAASHRWEMAKGEESLRLELAKRHAADETERAGLASPPRPVEYPVKLLAGIVLAGAFVFLRGRRR